MVLLKHFILTTCCLCKASSFTPTLSTLWSKLLTRRHFVLTTSSFSLLLPSALSHSVCPSSSITAKTSSFDIAKTSSLPASKHSTDMSLQTGYLNARDAAALDAELMSTPGFSLEQLMELAGLAVAEAVYLVGGEGGGGGRKKRVLLVCGPGNNGGDGLVAARHLVHFGFDATIVYPKPSSKPHFVNLVKQCEDMNIPVLLAMPSEVDAEQNKYDIIVDAIFGFSFDSTSKIREPFATVISKMIQLQKNQNATLISVDVPSGWDVDGGDLTGLNFHPDVLISLTAPKMSAKKFLGRHFVGGRFLPPVIAEKYGVQVSC
ncbi:hypothetical protein HJC23_012614 [Cyclotella cryptica]|uniref:NAD(P)H-hydrate epimerase n=1 Tax=Cyclotella cryptica TaxID=29204 RepID=A0ABD3QLW4_9STRA|eukprot:CCRYP_004146-RB/>CCRYP_004146-RB protein AED:0.04 eAED:0.04 QI:60/1/1/1/1/1/2/649/317